MRPALFITWRGRIFMTRKGGKKKPFFIVTLETFDPINAGDLAFGKQVSNYLKHRLYHTLTLRFAVGNPES